MLQSAQKYILAYPKEKQKQVSEAIESNGNIEVIENEDNKNVKDLLQEADYLLSSLKFAIGYLSPFSQKISFFVKLKSPKIVFKRMVLKSLNEKEKIKDIVGKVVSSERKIENLKREYLLFKMLCWLIEHAIMIMISPFCLMGVK